MYPEVLYKSTNDHYPDLIYFHEKERIYRLEFLYDHIYGRFLKPPYPISYYIPGLRMRYNQIYKPEAGRQSSAIVQMTREEFFSTYFDELLLGM